ncbi:hypothetical protein JCM5353_003183 [Sporobolomyces roseus]
MSKRRVQTTEPLNAFERDKRIWEIRDSYNRGKRPPKPQSKHELDILKERHQFVRSNDVDPSTLSWEDQVAAKYYDSLFKEFAIVNLKHWSTGAIGLRWRTEDEVLLGIGHLTCASMRCQFHQPSARLLESLEEEGAIVDPDSSTPLVETRLAESEMNFGYIEEGIKKSALVKVVLCRECGKRLRRGKEKAREARERAAIDAGEVSRGGVGEVTKTEMQRSSSERRERMREDAKEEKTRRRTSKDPPQEEEDYAPALPPDIEQRRRSSPSGDRWRSRSPSRSRRRSASPSRR